MERKLDLLYPSQRSASEEVGQRARRENQSRDESKGESLGAIGFTAFTERRLSDCTPKKASHLCSCTCRSSAASV